MRFMVAIAAGVVVMLLLAARVTDTLEQVLRRMVIDTGALTDEDVAAQTLRAIAPDIALTTETADVPKQAAPQELVSLDDAERRHIEAVLRATGRNQTQAAFILGIERKTLARKIKRLGISTDPS